MFGSKSRLHRKFQEWVDTGVSDKIEKEALKLYERSIKIRTKRMGADGALRKGSKKGDLHGSKSDGSRQKKQSKAYSRRSARSTILYWILQKFMTLN
ncbi:hypothetical protein LEP1GSC060_1961 [Leptospira weilii serovar Ranarum str. ICFT]|uniref:Uncharacterized protein n=1 Tax=Leptospira weilii serovar Ranarum str. ICFT TaxID=1218598 RepID=N1WMW2_9LEPT|nr:hypothetical protein LEP1GSC060_1961 [Leptospira weilii serovar Ranarum str. ICFT]